METVLNKIENIFSRKFILSAALVAGGIATGLKAVDNPSVQIAGVVIACVSGIVYTIVEGKIDATAIAGDVEESIAEIEKIKTDEKEVG